MPEAPGGRPSIRPPKAKPGDKVAVLSPSFAAPAVGPEVHDQAMSRLAELTGLVPVEYPTTRRLDASPQDRAADVNAALRDPQIRALLAVLGGDDQITVVPHLDAGALLADPKPFLGYSDNTNILNWMWSNGVAAFHGGSTQVHLGPGPAVAPEHARSLRAALLTGERLEITDPGESEDFGIDWADPAALTATGQREPTEPWVWAGPRRTVTGHTWGGCAEVLQRLLAAGRLDADSTALDGGVLLLETSEELPSAEEFGAIAGSLGERGVLAAVGAVLVAQPPASTLQYRPDTDEREDYRRQQREVAIDVVGSYNPEAIICVGVPFGHTTPQWLLPYGGTMTVDAEQRRIWADYD